jgi:hypothetical protein
LEEKIPIQEIKVKKKRIYTEEQKAKRAEYLKQWRKNNPERVKYLVERWRDEHREKVNESSKQHYLNRKEKKLAWGKEYYKENKDWITPRNKEYRDLHKDEAREYQKKYNLSLKIEALKLIGGCKCVICGDEDISHLTIDHVDGKGGYYRKIDGRSSGRLHQAIIREKLTEVELKNLQVLCWNHNSSRTREYLDLPFEKQTRSQRGRSKIWKEAFKFFGPCDCGISDLKFLTISHVHNDGAERRRNGESMGQALLIKFRKMGWPESLKEDFCLECWCCNCGRQYR